MQQYRPRIAIIGSGTGSKSICKTAYDIGLLLAQHGYEIVCGGLGGAMEAACKGSYDGNGVSIGILPGAELTAANPFVTVPIATGLGNMRNALVVGNAAAVIAVDGEWGTLSEIALAMKTGKTVISIGRWNNLDGVIPVASAKEAIATVIRLFPTHFESN